MKETETTQKLFSKGVTPGKTRSESGNTVRGYAILGVTNIFI